MTGLDHKQQAKRLQQKSPITLQVLGAEYITSCSIRIHEIQ